MDGSAPRALQNDPCAPLVPADCDLRSYDWFPLKHKQLTRSGWWMRASDQAKALNMELWCAAYEEVPAGSLPDDDIALSDLVGFGRRDLTAWLAVKDEVMAPWTLCSDGRWYHPTLAEVACETWARKQAADADRAAERERKRLKREGGVPPEKPKSSGGKADLSAGQNAGSAGTPPDVRGSGPGIPPENALTRHNKTEEEEAYASPSSARPRGEGEDREFAELRELYAEVVIRGRGSPVAARAAWDRLDPADCAALPSAVRKFAEARPWGSNGPPALQRFIGEDTWREFASTASVTSIVWGGPPELRAAVVAETTDAFARSYLDPATWSETARNPTLFALTSAAAIRLRTVQALRHVAIQDPILPRKTA